MTAMPPRVKIASTGGPVTSANDSSTEPAEDVRTFGLLTPARKQASAAKAIHGHADTKPHLWFLRQIAGSCSETARDAYVSVEANKTQTVHGSKGFSAAANYLIAQGLIFLGADGGFYPTPLGQDVRPLLMQRGR